MKKIGKALILVEVLSLMMFSATIGLKYITGINNIDNNILIRANAEETRELKLSKIKNDDRVFTEIQIQSSKDEIKKQVQDEEEVELKERQREEEEERIKKEEEERRLVEEQQKQEELRQKEDYYKSLNPYYGQCIKIKTSFYSEHESTNVPGNEVLTCVGTKLFDGVIAAPYDIPLYSIFLINNKLYMVLDRGNKDIIKMLDGEEKMKVDIYVPDTTSAALRERGIEKTECKIIRYGGCKENMNSDIQKMTELNKRLTQGETIELISEFNK